MDEFTAKEQAFIARLKKEGIDRNKLAARLHFLCRCSEVLAMLLALSMAVVYWGIGEAPKFYHLLMIASIVLVVLSQYVNWRYTLKVLARLDALEQAGEPS